MHLEMSPEVNKHHQNKVVGRFQKPIGHKSVPIMQQLSYGYDTIFVVLCGAAWMVWGGMLDSIGF